MPEIVIGFTFVLVVLTLALYGFVKLISGMFSPPDSPRQLVVPSEKTNGDEQRSLKEDVLGSSHLLNFLFSQNRISRQEYERLRGYLDQQYGNQWDLPGRLPSQSTPVSKVGPGNGSQTPPVEPMSAPESGAVFEDLKAKDAQRGVASLVDESSAGALSGEESRAPQSPAPWELPDPLSRPARRSFREVMSGFMLEKNIRLGELASGILIVGSAVGLVVSLREELRETIPYFSSMMFLLITAAIHAAGIYTLKTWKLRNTSRGTLLIGLLLIPLNLVAASILSGGEDRRTLSDPLLWLAITIGISSFAVMTWYSSKCLFRKGQIPLVISIMGCSVATLAINRGLQATGADDSSLRMLLWSLPLGFSFLAGAFVFLSGQWTRKKWSEKSVDRLMMFLGVSSFAALTASSVIVIRAASKPAGIVALMPLLSIVALTTTWMGRIVWRGAVGKSQKSHRVAGLSLHLLGLGIIAFALLYSASNPSVLLINSGLMAAGFVLFARHQNEPRLLAAGWIGFAVFVFALVNLWLEKFGWDTWAGAGELVGAAVSGQTGLAFLTTGAGVVAIHGLLSKRSADNPWFLRTGMVSGGAIFLIGCGLALTASFLNPENQFDVATASSLLGIAALGGLAASVYWNANTDRLTGLTSFKQLSKWIAVGVAGFLFVFLFHVLVWNRWTAEWANQAAFGIGANWELVFSIHGFLLAATALVAWMFGRPGASEVGGGGLKADLIARELGEFSLVSQLLGLLGAFFFLQYQTGFATGIAILMSIGLLMLVYVASSCRAHIQFWRTNFTFATGVSVVIFVSELVTRFGFCPGPSVLRFWFIQGIALSCWAIIASIVVWGLNKRSSHERITHDCQFQWWLVHGLVLVAAGLIGAALIGATNSELFEQAGQPWASLGPDRSWGFVFLIALLGALLISALRQPSGVTGAAIGLVWFLGWGIGADFFSETKATGTALRWLLPAGGALGALMVACRKP